MLWRIDSLWLLPGVRASVPRHSVATPHALALDVASVPIAVDIGDHKRGIRAARRRNPWPEGDHREKGPLNVSS